MITVLAFFLLPVVPLLAALADQESNTPGILLLCAALTLALLFYTLHVPGNLEAAAEKTRAAFLRERKDAVYENLRDLNFEYKAGKVPDSDFYQLRDSLEQEAAALVAEIENLENGAH